MAKYTRSKATDFTSSAGAVTHSALRNEVGDAISAKTLMTITELEDGDDVEFDFGSDALTGPEQTTLTTVCNDHTAPAKPTTKNKIDATVAPVTTNDADDGYGIGSTWVDVTADKVYICVDATVGAAVWIESGGTGGAHASDHTDGTDDIQSATAAQKGLATAAQITKLDAIEAAATADQSNAEIKTAYEANADSNEFSDAEQTKLAGIETAADITDAANVGAAGAVMDSDISAANGFLRKTGAGAYEAIKANLAASVAPTTTDDSGSGYAVGSFWIDTTADKSYVCVDSTATAAVWKDLTASGTDLTGLGTDTHVSVWNGSDTLTSVDVTIVGGAIANVTTLTASGDIKITGSGKLGVGVTPSVPVDIGATSTSMRQTRWSNVAIQGAGIAIRRSRGASVGSDTIVQDGDSIAALNFQAYDGDNFVQAALIKAFVDGVPGSGDMPGRLVFYTTPAASTTAVERMKLDSAGLLTMTGALVVAGTISGVTQFVGNWSSQFGQGPRMVDANSSTAAPTIIPNYASSTTGLAGNVSGTLFLVAAATEIIALTTTGSTLTRNAIGAVSADAALGLEFVNGTDAALNAQQYSPSRALRGEGWQKVADTSHEVAFHEQVIPVQQGDSVLPIGEYHLFSEVDHAGWVDRMMLTTVGDLTLQTANASLYGTTKLGLGVGTTVEVAITEGILTITEGTDFACGTATGSKMCTGSNQKWALWGASPVVQPSTTGTTTGFTAGSGNGANDDSTFTGGTGTAAYTVGDVVLALKQAGIMAAS